MSSAEVVTPSCEAVWQSHIGIPVRSLWVLLVYAEKLMEFKECLNLSIDESTELPDVLARLLTIVVRRRLRQNLSRTFHPKNAVLSRVRGRIDLLKTFSGDYLKQARIVCRFEEFTHDTTRNRLVRAALEAMGSVVQNHEIANHCSELARHLEAKGVLAHLPSRSELTKDQIARHDADDRLMVAVAKLALNQVLPAEKEGAIKLAHPNRDEALLRKIFERAVAGFYRHELHGRDGWRVKSQAQIKWQINSETSGISNFLPSMIADIMITQGDKRCIVIDTKFTKIVTKGMFDKERFKSQHIYQLYTYLRSQEGLSSLLDNASGILLYPSVDGEYNEKVTVQGHELYFATVNLSLPGDEIRQRLLHIIGK